MKRFMQFLALVAFVGTAHAVKLEYQDSDGTWKPGLKVNGVVVTEGTTAPPITGATLDANGNVAITLTGRLTYEAADTPAVPVGGPVDTSKFAQYGGVPGLFVTDVQACRFPKWQGASELDAAAYRTAVTVASNEASRCFPLFAFKDQPQTIRYSYELMGHLSYFDFSYGATLSLVPAADGQFTKTVTLSSAQAASGATLSYQLPDYRYVNAVATQVKKTFRLTQVSTARFAASDRSTPIAARTLTATLSAEAGDVGKAGRLYAVADVPGAGLFILNDKGVWGAWNGKNDVPAANVTLGADHSLDLVATPTDLSGIRGTVVYVGAGLDLADVGAKGKYKAAYTVQ